jgi:hypothetical protein
MASVERKLRKLDRNERWVRWIARNWWLPIPIYAALIAIDVLLGRWPFVPFWIALAITLPIWVRSGHYLTWHQRRIARKRAQLQGYDI